jgi:hypothetical protein
MFRYPHLLQRIILMEHQTSHFNALPTFLLLRPGDIECRMRYTARPPIELRVKALDQNDLLGTESRLVEPPVLISVLLPQSHKHKRKTLTDAQDHT